MIELKRILFPTDFSRCAEQAMTHAVYLAKQYEAELHMLHAVVLHGYEESNSLKKAELAEKYQRMIEQSAAERFSNSLQPHEKEQLKFEQVQKRGISTAPVILEYVLDYDIDLIVMGTHGRRGLGHLFLGSVAEEIVRSASCPVLTICERQQPRRIEELDRILVPIDFSDHSKQALRYAKEIAASYDARLQLLHIFEQPVYPSAYALDVRFLTPLMEAKLKCHQELERVFEETEGPLVSADIHVVDGRAASDIVEFAKENHADLIVIATHGLTGLEHLLMGSITEKVVRSASCPVFTVKTFGKSLIRRRPRHQELALKSKDIREEQEKGMGRYGGDEEIRKGGKD